MISNNSINRVIKAFQAPLNQNVIRKTRIYEKSYDICPHCKKEIGEKDIYFDEKGKQGPAMQWYHRSCMGPITFPDPDYTQYNEKWLSPEQLKIRTEQLKAKEKVPNGTIALASLNTSISGLHSEIANLKSQKELAETKIIELEKRTIEIHDGFQYKLNDLRDRIRGLLQGQLTRLLQTTLDASRSDPPWIKAIQERLEDALKLIDKEIKRLQSSGRNDK